MKKCVLLCAVLSIPALQASDCDFEKEIDQDLDLSGTETLSVRAAAGSLDIRGGSGDVARIRGSICVSDEEWLDKSDLITRGGRDAEIIVDLASNKSGWSWTGRNYAYLDLEIEVPEGIHLDVKDSSGEMRIQRVASLEVQDSSGDVEIYDIAGDVTATDSSGDLEFEGIGGNVTIESDSSGDIRGEDVRGSVLVMRDSSGGIRFSDVGQDFIVERDSSGDITARGVGGDFRVLRDGSGSIHASNVTGTVETPDKS